MGAFSFGADDTRMGVFSFGADDGNRTRVSGLGSERSAIELHPRDNMILTQKHAFVNSEKCKKQKDRVGEKTRSF